MKLYLLFFVLILSFASQAKDVESQQEIIEKYRERAAEAKANSKERVKQLENPNYKPQPAEEDIRNEGEVIDKEDVNKEYIVTLRPKQKHSISFASTEPKSIMFYAVDDEEKRRCPDNYCGKLKPPNSIRPAIQYVGDGGGAIFEPENNLIKTYIKCTAHKTMQFKIIIEDPHEGYKSQ